MHELSVALEICRIAEAQLGETACASLLSVGVEVGSDTSLDLDSLSFCLETLLSQPPFGAASPVLCPVTGDDLRVSYLEVDDGGPDDPAP